MKITEEFRFEEVRGLKTGYHPFLRPDLFVHIYFVDGLLIDTGQRRMSREICDYVKTLPVEQIFITHYHEDHTGNLDPLMNQTGVIPIASAECARIMQNPPGISLPQKMIWGDRPAFDLERYEKPVLETSNHVFELIHIPGHAPDMVGLLDKSRGWFFSADLYVNSFIGYFLKGERVLQQIHSIQKALTCDFDVMFCAHNPQLSGGREKLAKKLSYLENFYGEVKRWYDQGYGSDQILKNMNRKEYRMISFLSGGALSAMNMVQAAIEDIQAS